MAKKMKDKIQPTKPVAPSEQEKELRVLGVQLGRVFRDLEVMERELVNLREHVTALALQVQRLQRQAEVEKEGERRTDSPKSPRSR